jgi:uncharacterized membrane-anchored protein
MSPGVTRDSNALTKVPEVTLAFWMIKIAATTLGETGGDAVSMSMHLGYLVGSDIFAVVFLAAVALQIASNRFRPFVYWTTIIATTTVGTTLADFVDRSLGIGYAGGATILVALLTLAYYRTRLSRVYLFWAAFVLTRPLGAVVGDFLDKPLALGGLDFSRAVASTIILLFIVASVSLIPQRAAERAHLARGAARLARFALPA